MIETGFFQGGAFYLIEIPQQPPDFLINQVGGFLFFIEKIFGRFALKFNLPTNQPQPTNRPQFSFEFVIIVYIRRYSFRSCNLFLHKTMHVKSNGTYLLLTRRNHISSFRYVFL